jgi:hypothetical protein
VEYNVVLPVELSPQLRRSKCLGCCAAGHSVLTYLLSELKEAFPSSKSSHDEL